jgi:large repetitive protein
VAGFTADTDARSTEVVASNTTVYVGGRFTKVNGVSRASLAAVDAATGQVVGSFVNNITHGVGVNGAIGVQRLVLTHDMKKLIVVHTGLQINGQDRGGVAIIDTVNNQLLPWHSHLWEDNLEFVGGIQRAYGAAISPDDSYFVVTSGSGGDRPPINDTAVAFNLTGGEDVQPLWISRCFDSVYSVAISEKAVYIGGHFAWNESPTANDPWPGQADIGYGTGQGLSAYALGDQVVGREHLGALDPATGKALEWAPASDSFEGNKAMLVTSRGLITGGDAVAQGGASVGRIAQFDFSQVPAPNGVDTAITEPIMGRVENAGHSFDLKGTASATPAAGVTRVDVTVQNAGGQYLQDNLTTWGATNTIDVAPASPGAPSTTWTLPLTVAGNVKLHATARAFSGTTSDPSPDTKKFETFNLDDATPTVGFSLPAAGTVPTKTFTVTGTTADDKGVVSLTMSIRNDANKYLQDDGTVASAYNSFQIAPDVPGALSTTWQKEITVPDEGIWHAQVRANDTGGQSSLDTADRDWIVSATAQAPVVSITTPNVVTPPTAPQGFTVEPGHPITFTGSATDDGSIKYIDIALVNNSTQEYLTTDGSFGRNNGLNTFRLMTPTPGQKTVNWTYTTPFDLTPGSYQFAVLATDNDTITTPSSLWAVASFNAQVTGDAPPKATLTPPGTQPPLPSHTLNLTGTANDDHGVTEVRVSLRDADTAKYAKPPTAGGGTQAGYTYFTVPATDFVPVTPADPANPNKVTWSTSIELPTDGDWNVTAAAVDTVGQYDFASTGATARYLSFPTDAPPTFNMALLAPTDGTTFTDGKIFISGRAEDTNLTPGQAGAMAKVEVQVLNSLNQSMTSSGSFTNAPTWVTTFLTSPGTPGSNFSYTTPIIPAGNYTVLFRGTDAHDLVTTAPPSRTVIVQQPSNNPPTAIIDPPNCGPVATPNVCKFNGKNSTDETPASLTYAWNFGTGAGTGTGPNPTKTYTAPGTYTVTLTVKDQWGAVSVPAATTTVTITEPPGNGPPVPVINPPSCAGQTCNFSAVGTVDPNAGDSITYSWDFADPASGAANNVKAGSATSHVFTAGPSGVTTTYTVTLKATDGWGKFASTTRDVTFTAP